MCQMNVNLLSHNTEDERDKMAFSCILFTLYFSVVFSIIKIPLVCVFFFFFLKFLKIPTCVDWAFEYLKHLQKLVRCC